MGRVTIREGACQICDAVCLYAARDPRVRLVAGAPWVEIRHCDACGAWWDMQPASYPAVITREEAVTRVPDASGWYIMGPRIAPSNPEGLLVDVSREDAHPGDHDLHRQAELPPGATLTDLVTQILEPYLLAAPRARWVCRARADGAGVEGVGCDGAWLDFARIVSSAPGLTATLLVPDAPARSFAGQPLLEISCRLA